MKIGEILESIASSDLSPKSEVETDDYQALEPKSRSNEEPERSMEKMEPNHSRTGALQESLLSTEGNPRITEPERSSQLCTNKGSEKQDDQNVSSPKNYHGSPFILLNPKRKCTSPDLPRKKLPTENDPREHIEMMNEESMLQELGIAYQHEEAASPKDLKPMKQENRDHEANLQSQIPVDQEESNKGLPYDIFIEIRDKNVKNQGMQHSQKLSYEKHKLEYEIENKTEVSNTSVHSRNLPSPPLQDFDDQYESEEELGEGAHGLAKKIKYKGDYAVLKTAKREKDFHIEMEMRFLNYLKGAGGAPTLLAAGKNKFICTYIEHDKLEHFRYNPDKIVKKEAILLMYNLAARIKEIKDKSVAHNDLKENNVIVNMNTLECYIIDFGMAKCLYESMKPIPSNKCRWMAPEVKEGKTITSKSDVYSFGVMAKKMLYIKEIDNKKLTDICAGARAMNPEERPSIEEIISVFKKEC